MHAFEELRGAWKPPRARSWTLEVWRDGEMVEIALAPRRMDLPSPEGGFETRWLIGITGGLFFEPEVTRVGPGQALWAGVETVAG